MKFSLSPVKVTNWLGSNCIYSHLSKVKYGLGEMENTFHVEI